MLLFISVVRVKEFLEMECWSEPAGNIGVGGQRAECPVLNYGGVPVIGNKMFHCGRVNGWGKLRDKITRGKEVKEFRRQSLMRITSVYVWISKNCDRSSVEENGSELRLQKTSRNGGKCPEPIDDGTKESRAFFFLKVTPKLTSVANLFIFSPQSPPVHSCTQSF